MRTDEPVAEILSAVIHLVHCVKVWFLDASSRFGGSRANHQPSSRATYNAPADVGKIREFILLYEVFVEDPVLVRFVGMLAVLYLLLLAYELLYLVT